MSRQNGSQLADDRHGAPLSALGRLLPLDGLPACSDPDLPCVEVYGLIPQRHQLPAAEPRIERRRPQRPVVVGKRGQEGLRLCGRGEPLPALAAGWQDNTWSG
jgi:hypothetical protein